MAGMSIAERERRDRLYELGLKVCNTHGEPLPLANFAPRHDGYRGLNGTCRACKNAGTLAWQKANPEPPFCDVCIERKVASRNVNMVAVGGIRLVRLSPCEKRCICDDILRLFSKLGFDLREWIMYATTMRSRN